MPYQQGKEKRLPHERASRLGHLDVLKSELVEKFCDSFEETGNAPPLHTCSWQGVPTGGAVLPLIFGVDGSLQVIQSKTPPHKALAFVKTALLRLDTVALSAVNKESPHPFVLRDLMDGAALYHATVFPLRNIAVSGVSLYNAVRQGIFESVKDASLSAEPMETLKWLMYEKWDSNNKSLPLFQCPHCEENVATLPYNAEQGKCSNCNGELLITDVLGFHQEMGEDSAPDIIASNYMLVHETLLLFTGIRHFWENSKDTLKDCLFVKDGPLAIRAQYSKMVAPIRRFLAYAKAQGVIVNIVGQEKTGYFVDHLELIGSSAPVPSISIPNDFYIKTQIQHRSENGDAYGIYTNYGAKVFVRLNDYHKMVISIPTGNFTVNPSEADLIGADRIFPTLYTILSSRYESALLPIELAHGIASLSTYPSAQILKMFAETHMKKQQ